MTGRHVLKWFILGKIKEIYRVFQKELYNFESLYKFIQRTYTTF
jgi:hypothetical protein